MTGEIVNLRRVRKARVRAERADQAAANRLAHGRTRAEREAGVAEAARVERRLDGHRLSADEAEPDTGGGDA